MSDQIVQLIRTIFQTVWGVILGLAVVQDVLVEAGFDTTVAQGVAVTLSMAVVVVVSQQLAGRGGAAGKAASMILNGVDRAPAYEVEA